MIGDNRRRALWKRMHASPEFDATNKNVTIELENLQAVRKAVPRCP